MLTFKDRKIATVAVCAVVGIAAFIAFRTEESWWPAVQRRVDAIVASRRSVDGLAGESVAHSRDAHGVHAGGHSGHDHGGPDHPEHGHADDEVSFLPVSVQAQRSLGLSPETLKPVILETYWRTMTVPGMIVETPGRTRLDVSTPMAGVITRVHAVEGEAVREGAVLFELRITAEELVESQTELLKTLGDLDVEQREIARLTAITETGAVSQKTLLDRQYARDKLENLLIAQKESLRLHGLSDDQIEGISRSRRLFRDLTIVAPGPGAKSDRIQLSSAGYVPVSIRTSDPEATGTPLVVTHMPVHVGQTVAAGTTLAELADYSELSIQGRAFERDSALVADLASSGAKLQAILEGTGRERVIIPELELVYAAAAIEPETRTLAFYVRLPNQLIRESESPDGRSFVEWKYRPGRRLQLQLPVEELRDQIVLPVDAVARDGVESYVFQQNGDRFDRLAVHVLHRDSTLVVIAADGSVFPGDVIARTGAHQLQMALKNKSGGGIDPHAGHQH